jgi:cold-inducible RNA-binding protein
VESRRMGQPTAWLAFDAERLLRTQFPQTGESAELGVWSFLLFFDFVTLGLFGRTTEQAPWVLTDIILCFPFSPVPPADHFHVPLSGRSRKQSMHRTFIAIRSDSMGKKLYVGNLADSVLSSDLREWFTSYGTVLSAKVIIDRETDRGKGFAFVEMETDAQAQAAICGLNEQEYEGRRLTVNEAKPRVAYTTGTRDESGGRRY